jgi:hypothetical protein
MGRAQEGNHQIRLHAGGTLIPTVSHYNWKHIPSGKGGRREFNESHAGQANAPLIDGCLRRGSALELMNLWNANSFGWHYWLD